MGLYVNYLITGFFILLIGIPILLPFASSNYNLDWNFERGTNYGGIGSSNITFNETIPAFNETIPAFNLTKNWNTTYIQPYAVFLKGMYSEANIYATKFNSTHIVTPVKTAYTIYDFSSIILCVILLIHQYMVMFVARESALIYLDER
jgi:hypothetical protein